MTAESPAIAPQLQRYAALDQRLLAAVREIRILSTVAWSASLENRRKGCQEKGVRDNQSGTISRLILVDGEVGCGPLSIESWRGRE